MLKIMHKNSGFSFMELMTIIGIIGLLAAIAIPNMIGWRGEAQLRGAAENLRGDLQLARLKAVQENTFVAVKFSETGYLVFTDNAPDADNIIGDLDEPYGERRLRDRQLETNVSIDLGITDFNGNDYVRFNNRGLPDSPGGDDKVKLVAPGGDWRIIELNRVGRINIIRNE